MANKYTKKQFTQTEIQDIISLYSSGMSFTEIGKKMSVQKNRVKQILANKNVFVIGRDEIKKEFTETEKQRIINLYLNEKMSCKVIGEHYGVSREPIQRLIKASGILRTGISNGVKINLTLEQKDIIKFMYLEQYYSAKEIAKKIGLTNSFIDKYLASSGFRRNTSEGVSIGLVKRYSGTNYSDYLKNLPEFKKYTSKVLKITRTQPINELKNFEKRGRSGINGAYHLDHKYSITEGFKNKISPEIIGSVKNLEFIPWEENVKKRTKCSITIQQLNIN